MKHFKAIIKEKGVDGVIRTLLPEFVGDVTKESYQVLGVE